MKCTLCQEYFTYGVAPLWAERQRKADHTEHLLPLHGLTQQLLLAALVCPVWTDLQRSPDTDEYNAYHDTEETGTFLYLKS